ncbi:MAG: hypothetical protein ACRENH_11865 [Gemmatimonadaceae bacterium]
MATKTAHIEQLKAMLRNPHSERHRKWVFGVLADIESPADVEPWLKAAHDLNARGVIDEDGWVYFAAIFLESLTLGDGVSDPELVRIQREMDALDAVESWKRPDDDDDEPWKQRDDDYGADGFSSKMRALFAAYDARAVVVTASYLCMGAQPIGCCILPRALHHKPRESNPIGFRWTY